MSQEHYVVLNENLINNDVNFVTQILMNFVTQKFIFLHLKIAPHLRLQSSLIKRTSQLTL